MGYPSVPFLGLRFLFHSVPSAAQRSAAHSAARRTADDAPREGADDRRVSLQPTRMDRCMRAQE